MAIEVTSEVIDALHAAARRAHPLEACGILLGAGPKITRFCETRNVHDSPQTQFEIDPAPLIDAHRDEREGGMQVLGYFHSHPSGSAEPSATDQARSARDGKVWAICAGATLSFWRDDPGGFAKLPYTIKTG